MNPFPSPGPDSKSDVSPTGNAVELRNVRFSWPGPAPAILNIDHLRIPKAGRVFLFGPSGSGKSTLLSLIGGLLAPQSGTVRILDNELSALSGAARDRFRADHIGFIFQMFNLIPYLSVVENVCLPCGFSARRRHRAMRNGASVEVEALRLLQRLDMGGDDVLRKPVRELSVGQQQRVAAARALIGAPELIVADEPTSSLDADRRGAFLDLLFQECGRERSALIFVSHDPSIGARFDQIVSLADINVAAGGGMAA